MSSSPMAPELRGARKSMQERIGSVCRRFFIGDYLTFPLPERSKIEMFISNLLNHANSPLEGGPRVPQEAIFDELKLREIMFESESFQSLAHGTQKFIIDNFEFLLNVAKEELRL